VPSYEKAWAQGSEIEQVLEYLNQPKGGLRGLARYFGVITVAVAIAFLTWTIPRAEG